jgi:hypothetical protein
MNDELDTLLRNDLLHPPADFTRTVMQRVAALPLPGDALPHPRWRRLRRAAAAAGLIGSALLGLSQLAAYVFGLWFAATAI